MWPGSFSVQNSKLFLSNSAVLFWRLEAGKITGGAGIQVGEKAKSFCLQKGQIEHGGLSDI